MNAFVWQYTENVTDSWHSGGGILAIAATLDEARVMIAERCPGNNGKPCHALEENPDLTLVLAGGPGPDVLIFPDAGCC